MLGRIMLGFLMTRSSLQLMRIEPLVFSLCNHYSCIGVSVDFSAITRVAISLEISRIYACFHEQCSLFVFIRPHDANLLSLGTKSALPVSSGMICLGFHLLEIKR